MDIKELVYKAKNGDSYAFGQIYDEFSAKIFRYIKIKVQSPQEAEDVLQEVFLKAYRGLEGLNMENLNFSAWLYKVAGNTINDFFRKKYRSPQISELNDNLDVAGGSLIEKDFEINWDWNLAHTAFQELPPIYRQVLELRFVQDLSLSEVSEILNKNNLSVRLIQHRALKKIRKILNNSNLEYGKI